MAFKWDDLQKKRLDRWGRLGGQSVRAEVPVAGAELKIDAVLPQGLSYPTFFDFLPAGLVAVENKAPGDRITLAMFLRFHGKCSLLLEQQRKPDWESSAGLMLGARIARQLLDQRRLAPRLIEPGRWLLAGPVLPIHLVAANLLLPSVRTAPIILYYGSDRAVARLLDAVDPRLYLEHVSEPLLERRKVVLNGLLKRGIDMSKVKIEIVESLEEIGLEHVAEEVGIERLIEAVGIARALEKVGIDRVIEAVGLERVIREVGPERLEEEIRRFREHNPD